MTGEQIAFGLQLRRAREQRQIALAEIAEAAKIKYSLLAGLERGDTSHWPAGIYRRAFLREYVMAVQLPWKPTLSEFMRLFPEAGDTAPISIDPPESAGPLRLTLGPERGRYSQMVIQLAAAALDTGAALQIAALMSTFLGWSFWTSAAIAALGYYSVGTSVAGQSPATWFLKTFPVRRRRLLRGVAPADSFVEQARSVSANGV